MILKCIGGQFDGEWHQAYEPNRVGDCVKIQKLPEPAKMHFDPADAMAITYYVYIIDCFHFSKDERYLFLRPDDWTNKRAMIHQFNK